MPPYYLFFKLPFIFFGSEFHFECSVHVISYKVLNLSFIYIEQGLSSNAYKHKYVTRSKQICIGFMSHILLGIVLEPLLIFAPIFLEKDRLKLRLLCLSTA